MGRAKLKMEVIENERSRKTTFKKRRVGLIRKLHELSTLCDVDACMIMYGPNGNNEIFPSDNPDKVRRLIDLYKSENHHLNKSRFGIIDYFQNRKKQIEDEVAKLRRKNLEAKYPTCPDILYALSVPQLRQLQAHLTYKAAQVKTLIELRKGNMQLQPMPMPMRQFDGGSTSANIQHNHQVLFEYAPPLPQQYLQLPPFPPQLQRSSYTLQSQYFGNGDAVQEEFIQYIGNGDGAVHEEFIQYFANGDGDQDHQVNMNFLPLPAPTLTNPIVPE